MLIDIIKVSYLNTGQGKFMKHYVLVGNKIMVDSQNQ